MQFTKYIATILFVFLIAVPMFFSSSSEVDEPLGELHMCFYPDPSADPSTADQSFQDAHNNKRYVYMGSGTSRWTSFATPSASTVNGSPLTLTWSIIPDGLAISGMAGEPAAVSNLTSFLLGIYGSQAAYIAMFTQAFNSWTAVTGVKFVHEANDDGATFFQTAGSQGVRGDIRIGGHFIDGGYNTLAYTFSPNSGDMVIDTGDSFFAANSNWMWQVIAHELGHALGLGHVCPMDQTKLMEPYFSTKFSGPQVDDILGANSYYGDIYESNNAITSSYNLGSLSNSIQIPMASLHSTSDLDFYSFTPAHSGSTTVVVYPTGKSYAMGAVGAGGVANSCSGTFPTVNTVANLNLVLDVYSGSTLIASSNTGGLGTSESLTISVVAGTQYNVKVYTSSTSPAISGMNPQLYNMSISNVAAAASPAVSVSASSTTTPTHSSPPSVSATSAASKSSAASASATSAASKSSAASASATSAASKSSAASASATSAASKSSAASASATSAASKSSAASASATSAASKSSAASASATSAASKSAVPLSSASNSHSTAPSRSSRPRFG